MTVNAVTRPFLLPGSDGGSRGNAQFCTHAAPTIPHSLKLCLSALDDPFIAFYISKQIYHKTGKIASVIWKIKGVAYMRKGRIG
jgi:hypothetical protein